MPDLNAGKSHYQCKQRGGGFAAQEGRMTNGNATIPRAC
jgi:hypothetical protein